MLSYKELDQIYSNRTENRKLCPSCGHSILLGRKDKKICTHCGCYVFKDQATEFNYRLKEKMIKAKRESN